MPVRVRTSVQGDFTLAARGGLPVVAALDGRSVDAFLPLLAVQSLMTDATWRLGGSSPVRLRGPLVPLQENDCLVGYTASQAANGLPLFPGKTVIPVQLDPLDPLPEPLAAWEALDAIVLEGRALEWLTERRLARLLAAGTTVAVGSIDRPSGGWTWTRQGAYWVARQPLAGPNSVVAPAAYAPTSGWRSGRSARFRRQTTLGLVAFSIALTAVSLWRSRWGVAAGVAVSVAACGGIVLWARSISPIANAGGAIVAIDGEVNQIDHWRFYQTLTPASLSVPWQPNESIRPVFASGRHPETVGARLRLAADGEPVAFEARLEREVVLAILSREMKFGGTPAPLTTPVDSPLRDVARDLYLPNGGEIVGQSTTMEADDRLEPEHQWPVVVVRRSNEN